MRTVARVENFRDRPDNAPDASPDARTDTAADRTADKPAIRFADGSRVRPADLELSPDAKPPPGAEDKREAYLREYKKQLAPADTDRVRVPNELAGARKSADEGPAERVEPVEDRVRNADGPDEVKLRIERPDANDPYEELWVPTTYDEHALDGPDGERTSLFDGRPSRDDTQQGQVGDCGIIAGIGAVAGTAPDKIKDAIVPNPDGTYSVTMSQTKSAWPDGITTPSHEKVTFTVTPDLPVRDTDGGFAGADAERVAWPAILEKAIAGSDQAWTTEQKTDWASRWADQKEATNRDRAKDDLDPLPDGPVPSGYTRLNQGTDHYDWADLLTGLTGRQAEVRPIPDDDQELIKSFFADKLAYDKPILVGTRSRDREAGESRFPHQLIEGHVYEVTGLDSDGRIELRNPHNHDHPDPLTPDDLREYFSDKNSDGTRDGRYTTLS